MLNLPRRSDALIALTLVTASSPALAHGMESVFQFLVTVGAVLGVIGGAATAALRFKFMPGIAASLALLFVAGLVFVLVSLGPTSDPLGDIGAMAALLAMFAALPLGASFAVAFAVVALLRSRLRAERGSG